MGDDVPEDKKAKPTKKRDNGAGTRDVGAGKRRTSPKKCIFLIAITHRFNRLAALAAKECRQYVAKDFLKDVTANGVFFRSRSQLKTCHQEVQPKVLLQPNRVNIKASRRGDTLSRENSGEDSPSAASVLFRRTPGRSPLIVITVNSFDADYSTGTKSFAQIVAFGGLKSCLLRIRKC